MEQGKDHTRKYQGQIPHPDTERHTACDKGVSPWCLVHGLQGYLAHKKPPSRTLPKAYVYGPRVIVGVGLFLMGEVPL